MTFLLEKHLLTYLLTYLRTYYFDLLHGVVDLLQTICCGFVTGRECGVVLFSVACVCL